MPAPSANIPVVSQSTRRDNLLISANQDVRSSKLVATLTNLDATLLALIL